MDGRLALVIGACCLRDQPPEAGGCGQVEWYYYRLSVPDRTRQKFPTIPVLAKLARVRNVPLSRLLDAPEALASDRSSVTDADMVLYRALTQPAGPYEPPSVARRTATASSEVSCRCS
jgi:hypothetical protein